MPVKKIFSNIIKSSEDKSLDMITQQRYKEYDVILHIGAPKTGSSAIQNFLLKNRDVLLKKGIYYPRHALDKNGISGGHSLLAIALMEKRDEDAEKMFIDWYLHAQNLHKTLLISSESFFNIPELMQSILSDKKILVISYYRSPIEYIVSVHNQLIKRHYETKSLYAYIESFLDTTQNTSNLIVKSWINIYQKWEQLVGKENFIVRSYQKEAYYEGRIEKDLIHQLGIGFSDFKLDDIYINKSYTESALELKRLINYVLLKEHKLNHRIDLQLQNFSDKHLSSPLDLEEVLGDELYKKLISYTQELEETIVNRYVENFIYHQKRVKRSSKRLQKEISSIEEVFHYLCDDDLEIKTYLRDSTLIKLQSGILNFSVFRLAQLLEIPNLDEYEVKDHWFSPYQLKNMVERKYAEADFLRDIAKLLLERKDYVNAKNIIEKALTLRPKGSAILKLQEEINQRLLSSE